MPNQVFTLEALAARHGDCLLLHWGSPQDPNLILIDGGPNGVWRKFLRPRLDELRETRQDPLSLKAVMVSHIDDDHIVYSCALAASTASVRVYRSTRRCFRVCVRREVSFEKTTLIRLNIVPSSPSRASTSLRRLVIDFLSMRPILMSEEKRAWNKSTETKKTPVLRGFSLEA